MASGAQEARWLTAGHDYMFSLGIQLNFRYKNLQKTT
jgi:hypothetical protein